MTTPISGDVKLLEVFREQAEFNARFNTLEKDYYATVAKTNMYQDAVRAQGENYAAYLRLSEFAEKHPQYKRILPMSPIAPQTDGCAIS